MFNSKVRLPGSNQLPRASLINASFIKQGALLLLPGLLTAVAIVFLASGKWSFIQRHVTTYIVQLVQLQMLGLTICKFGIDQIGFALLKQKAASRLKVNELFLRRVLPASSVYALIVSFFQPLAGMVVMITVIAEVYSIVAATELNANKRHYQAALLMALGYPLFFVFVFITSTLWQLNATHVAILLSISSMMKAGAAHHYRKQYRSEEAAECPIHIQVPLQQGLNFLLFRVDQVVLSTLFLNTAFFNGTALVNDLVYLTKYPELVTGVLTGLSALYLQPMSNDLQGGKKLLVKNHYVFLLLVFLGCMLIGCVHYIMGSFVIDRLLVLYILFFLNCLLILPVNLVTFYFLKRQKFTQINRSSVISILLGIVFISISLLTKQMLFFAMAVPVQMITYLLVIHTLDYRPRLYSMNRFFS